MRNYIKNIISFLIIITPLYLKGQTSVADRQIENIIESIIEKEGDETDAITIIEDLQEYSENPLNLNTANRNQLSHLHILNDLQIEKILDYRTAYGPILTIYELNTLDCLNPELLSHIEPFVSFDLPDKKHPTLSRSLKRGRHELFLRSMRVLQKPKGYKNKEDGTIPFEGNRAKYYSRYRYKSGDNLSIGFTTEKDPGEAFFSGTNKTGFDFYSGHISYRIGSIIENITIGDFTVRCGQGLVCWQGFSTGKSINTLSTSKVNEEIRPYTSSDENNFFRGLSTTLTYGSLRCGLFFSRKKRDANTEYSQEYGSYFTSLQTSGYHRTKGEISNKNSITDTNIGTMLNWRSNNIKIGFSLLYQHFNIPFIPADKLYNRYRFRGNKNVVTGLNYLYSKGKYQLFGETALSKSKGKALIQGLTAYLHDRIQISALFRHFDKNFQSLWATAFSEGSTVANETGFYFGTKIIPLKKVTLSAYSDLYKNKWITYTTAGPANGWDINIQTDFKISDKFNFYCRYKNEEKDKKFKIDKKFINHPEQIQKIRFHIEYSPLKQLILKTRGEHTIYKGLERENGRMIYQDFQLRPQRWPLTLNLRGAWFNTDSYKSRIYAYENDLLYTFSIPAYFGKGFRTYLNIKYKFNTHIEMWFKLSNTRLPKSESIGSGYNTIEGKNKTEVKFQIRLKI